MMKIAIVVQGRSGGGSERVAVKLANFFSGSMNSVLLICAYTDEDGYYIDKAVKIAALPQSINNKSIKLIKRNLEINRIITEFKPNVTISFLTREMVLSQLCGHRVIYSQRNDPTSTDTTFFKKIFRDFVFSKSAAVVFQTEGAAALFPNSIRRKGIIIPNPLDKEKLPIYNWTNRKNTFIAACRLNKQKNIPLLIDAFCVFHESHPDYSLEIYGKGELEEYLSKMISEKDASSYIKLRGYTDNIYNIMSNSFGFVLSSDYEGLSNSMLEALAIGIPTICTDCPPGGAAEYITDGENGLLAPVGDVKTFAEKLRLMADNPDLCRKMSQNSQHIREILDEKIIMEKWNEVLQSVVNR